MPLRQHPASFKRGPKASKKPRDDFVQNEDDSDEFSRTGKKAKKEMKRGPVDGTKRLDDNGNAYWELGGRLRRVTLSEFKGAVLVSIREYYEKDGKVLPGKKGISLTLEQYSNLISVMMEKALAKKSSAELVRPVYDTKFNFGKVKDQREEGIEEPEVKDEYENESDELKRVKQEEDNEEEDEDGEDGDGDGDEDEAEK